MLTVAEIAAIVHELGPRLRGGQVQKIREPAPGTILLNVRVPGESTRVVISGRGVAPRIAEAESNGTTLPEPSTLGRWLRATLKGRRLLDIEAVPNERIVVLTFEAGRLVAELTGGSANLFGCAPDGRILAMAHRGVSPQRDLRPNQLYTPPAPRPGGEARPLRFESALEVERAAVALEAASDAQRGSAARRQLLGRARKRLNRLHRKVSADIARAEGAERLREQGELLKSQLHLVTRGAESVLVTDWYAEGTPQVRVALDPALNAQANLARLFTRYRKAKAGTVRAAERLIEVEDKQFALELLAEEPLEIEALQHRLIAEGFLRPANGGGRPRAKVAPRVPYRTYENARGDRLLVGRGGADNHALTFQVGKGNDLWLHVRDAPGAHVIIPKRGGATPQETILDAAALAVRHSDLKGEPVVEVTVTERKHVRPVKGGPPGRVTIAAARTVTVADADVRADGLRRIEAPTPR
jgi:predicted ribosome quality control (RQC) complex YloA/Tae2 family protein